MVLPPKCYIEHPITSNQYKVIANASAAKSLQSCPTLCDPTDGSPPGSYVHGILQARTLEWTAISFSRWLMRYFKFIFWTKSSESGVCCFFFNYSFIFNGLMIAASVLYSQPLSVPTATFHVLKGHVWLVAALLNCLGLGYNLQMFSDFALFTRENNH